MARVIIIPEANDTRNQIKMLIGLNKTTGAAVIVSQCLHFRQEGVEDGTDEGTSCCRDCGATGKLDAVPEAVGADHQRADGCQCSANDSDPGVSCACECHVAVEEEQK